MKWRRLIYFILWLASLVGISYYGGAISYGMFWGLTLVPLIAFIYLLLTFLTFKIYQKIETRSIVAKQPMPYYFVLSNETFFPFVSVSVRLYSKLSQVNDMVDGREYHLLPKDEYVYQTKLVCKYRGEYEVGVKEITLMDIFGLFRFRYRIPSPICATVLPRILHLEEIESLKEVLNTSHMETLYHPMEPDVVTRDYIVGDALKWIHWKASAKEQKLKTRKLLGQQRKEVAIIYDTKRYGKDMYEYLPLENQILETVLAVGAFFAEKNLRFSSYYAQRGVRQCRVESFQQFQMFYEEVSNVIFYEEENVNTVFEKLYDTGGLTQVHTLVFVIHELETHTMKRLQELAHRGLSVVVYLITDTNAEEWLKQGNSRLRLVVLPTQGNLEELL